MEPGGAAEPEFDAFGMQAVAAPVQGARDFAGLFFREFANALFEQFAASEDAALVGDGSADLAGPRTATEVLVDIDGFERGD